jgi:GNAT superfamily N-acetyltransferase
MAIRRADIEDADTVATLFLAARAQMRYLPPVHTEAETREWIRDTLLATREVWVAVEDQVVGFAALGDRLLEHLYVHPAEQSRGVGARLLALAKERRPSGLQLWVYQRNEGARRFYERHGFTVVRLTDGAGNEDREPDALYEWRPAQ